MSVSFAKCVKKRLHICSIQHKAKNDPSVQMHKIDICQSVLPNIQRNVCIYVYGSECDGIKKTARYNLLFVPLTGTVIGGGGGQWKSHKTWNGMSWNGIDWKR